MTKTKPGRVWVEKDEFGLHVVMVRRADRSLRAVACYSTRTEAMRAASRVREDIANGAEWAMAAIDVSAGQLRSA